MKFENGKTYWCTYCNSSRHPVVKPWEGTLIIYQGPWCDVWRLIPPDKLEDDIYPTMGCVLSKENVFHTEAEAWEYYKFHEKV